MYSVNLTCNIKLRFISLSETEEYIGIWAASNIGKC